MFRCTALITIALAIFLSGAVRLSAQERYAAVTAAQNELKQGHYLAAVDGLKNAAYAPDGVVRDPVALQVWRQFSPFVSGELDPAIPDRAESDDMLGPGWARKIDDAVTHDAIAEIVRRAKATDVVILNEAHDSPRDRAFGLEVARALRPLGYSVLAVEAIRTYPIAGEALSGVGQLRRDGFVRFSTGDYTRDPVFAAFLREALSLGYEPVAYDATSAQLKPGSGIAEREQAQADNLSAAVFGRRPIPKVFIYVGVSHVAERPLGRTEWLAARLKRMTGIDPLTIDQATLTDISTRSAHDLAAAKVGNRPAILFDRGKPLVLGRYSRAVDLQVVHPRRSYERGRPAWLATLGGRPLSIPNELLPVTGRRLVQAFAANAPNDAVPLDQVLVEAGKPVPALMAPAGPVRFQTQP